LERDFLQSAMSRARTFPNPDNLSSLRKVSVRP
jgi:hypothetical protein